MKMSSALANLILGGGAHPAVSRDPYTPPGCANLNFDSIEIRQNEVVFLHKNVAMLTLGRGLYGVRGVCLLYTSPSPRD